MVNGLNFDLIVIVTFFFLSLAGAVVLFKFFKSTAMVQSKQYQAGGAIAGFIIIFILLSQAYQKIKSDTVAKLTEDLKAAQLELDKATQNLSSVSIDGTITPYQNDAKIVLAVSQTDADMQGKFKFSAKCIDPDNDDVKLYLISPTQNKFKFMRIESKQAMNNISFPTN
ncbi:MAG: hypothetical protein HZA04_07350 [Nitrospinae bacterium]|nr:hypothetical protein [Nitrospinota bacterium]